MILDSAFFSIEGNLETEDLILLNIMWAIWEGIVVDDSYRFFTHLMQLDKLMDQSLGNEIYIFDCQTRRVFPRSHSL